MRIDCKATFVSSFTIIMTLINRDVQKPVLGQCQNSECFSTALQVPEQGSRLIASVRKGLLEVAINSISTHPIIFPIRLFCEQ